MSEKDDFSFLDGPPLQDTLVSEIELMKQTTFGLDAMQIYALVPHDIRMAWLDQYEEDIEYIESKLTALSIRFRADPDKKPSTVGNFTSLFNLILNADWLKYKADKSRIWKPREK